MRKVQRSYDQFCGLALGLDRAGERWALLVVRELLAGPRRFSDLLEGMPGVATNTLTTRLDEMEQAGLILRRRLPPPAASAVYELTDRGRSLEPVILAFARWGLDEIKALHADPKRAAQLSPLRSSSLALALKAFFVTPDRKVAGRLQLRLPTGDLGIAVKAGALELTYGSIDSAEAELTLREDVVIALAIHEVTLTGAIKRGVAKLSGDPTVVDRVLGCFRLE